MHLAVRSKSARKILNKTYHDCDACGNKVEYFVQILASIKKATYHTVCINCYEDDTWQTKISRKAVITKEKLPSGSTKKVSKHRESHSQDRSEENGQEIFTSHWTDDMW